MPISVALNSSKRCFYDIWFDFWLQIYGIVQVVNVIQGDLHYGIYLTGIRDAICDSVSWVSWVIL